MQFNTFAGLLLVYKYIVLLNQPKIKQFSLVLAMA